MKRLNDNVLNKFESEEEKNMRKKIKEIKGIMWKKDRQEGEKTANRTRENSRDET